MAADNPLGCKSNAWDDFSVEERRTISIVEDWDFGFLAGDQLLRHKVADRHMHDEACEELKKFFLVKILRDPHPMGCFGPVIAAALHAFILDTQRYEEFCAKTYGKTIHHKPSNYGKGVLDNTTWMAMYREWFGDFPRVWKMDLNGQEIPGFEHSMNVAGNVSSADMDSDDGAFAVIT